MFRKILVALCVLFPAVACSAPYHAPKTVGEARQMSEQKFPTTDKKLIDELTDINIQINHTLQYVSDAEQYGEEDLWVMAPASGKGDCEDYALTKMYLIQNVMFADKNGVDPLSQLNNLADLRIDSVLVYYNDYDGKGVQADGHAILAVRLPNHEVAYLDLLHDELMTRKELSHWQLYAHGEADRYEFYDWKVD